MPESALNGITWRVIATIIIAFIALVLGQLIKFIGRACQI